MKVIVLGTGGNCVDIAEMLVEEGYECMGFLDDNRELWGRYIKGIKVLGPLTEARNMPEHVKFINGIGSTRTYMYKDSIIWKTGVSDDRFIKFIHRTSYVSRSAEIGNGSVIFPNVFIGSNVRIGKHVIVLSNSSINHDSRVGDFSIITSNVSISGNVTIGRLVYIGTGAKIREGRSVGDLSLVGMGSVVIDDVPSGEVHVGVPAKFLRRVDEGL